MLSFFDTFTSIQSEFNIIAKFNIYKEELVKQAFIPTTASHPERIVFILFLYYKFHISLLGPAIGMF